MARITGRVEVLVNGELLFNKAGAVAEGVGLSGMQNFELEPIMGDTGIHGFKETPIIASVSVTITDRDDISLNDLAAIREDGTVTFRSSGSGKSYVMNEATCTRNISITAGEGETPIKFVGAYWTETTY